MQYNFNEVINRKNTNSFKWDMVDKIYGTPDLLPLWVADMDFKSPQPVIDSITQNAIKGLYGYSACMDDYYNSIINWFKDQHKWEIKKEWIIYNPGVVPALGLIVQAFTQPGDNVIIQRPVYYPFTNVVKDNDRNILNNSLVLKNNSYIIDFKDFEQKASDKKTKLFFLCSPHNPGGRVWTKKELTKLAEICIKNNVLIISDEIHCDLAIYQNNHIPIASISKKIAEKTITLTAPTKTFNIAGLIISNAIISSDVLRKKFDDQLKKIGLVVPSQFGIIATQSAYEHGHEWLSQLKIYIEQNINFVEKYISANIPQITVMKPQASYLVWLDCNALGLNNKKLSDLFIKAGIALSNGYTFGEEGSGFMRINIACPKKTLEKALNKIKNTIKQLPEPL